VPTSLSSVQPRKYIRLLRDWGFVPHPDRNMGDHTAFLHPGTQAVVTLRWGGNAGRAGVPFESLKKAVEITGCVDIEEFLAGPDARDAKIASMTSPAPTTDPTTEESTMTTTVEPTTETVLTEEQVAVKPPMRKRGQLQRDVAEVLFVYGPNVHISKVADELGIQYSNASVTLNLLATRGHVAREGKGLYTLTPMGRKALLPDTMIPENAAGAETTTPTPTPEETTVTETLTVEPTTEAPEEMGVQEQPEEPTDYLAQAESTLFLPPVPTEQHLPVGVAKAAVERVAAAGTATEVSAAANTHASVIPLPDGMTIVGVRRSGQVIVEDESGVLGVFTFTPLG
jgi:hypothetical protein